MYTKFPSIVRYLIIRMHIVLCILYYLVLIACCLQYFSYHNQTQKILSFDLNFIFTRMIYLYCVCLNTICYLNKNLITSSTGLTLFLSITN